MALQNLPRPWLLAALADMPMTMLAHEDAAEPNAEGREHVLLRAEARRRRLSARQSAEQWSDQGYGEDCWGGVDQWRDLEADRAN
jgi:hypothetical protein